MATYTVANIVKLRDKGVAGLIEDVTLEYPLVNQLPAIAVPGNTYNHPYTSADADGEFRSANTGKTQTVATVGSDAVTLKYFDMSWGPLDVSVADVAFGGPSEAITVAQTGALRGGLGGLEKQVLYGTNATLGDADGFSGFLQLVDSSMVVDAGGSSTGACSDVWLVNYKQAKLILGLNGTITRGAVMKGPAYDSSGNQFYAYSQDLGTWAALTGIQSQGLARIKNVDTTTTLTADMIYEAQAKFKVGHEPNIVVMSRRSQNQLREDIDSTNYSAMVSPLPNNVAGLPIVVSDKISDTIAAA